MQIPELVRQRFQNGRREEVRREAATKAAELVIGTRQWGKDEVHELLGHLQTDWSHGKLVRNRFQQGLVGQQEKWLLEAIERVGAWLGAARDAAATGIGDEAAARLLEAYWEADIKNPYLFPTVVLHILAPDRFVPLTRTLVAALNAVDPGKGYERARESGRYLEICRAVRSMCEAEEWPLCLADAALHAVQKDVEPPPEPADFDGYPAEALKLLRELPRRTKDSSWHHENKGRYEEVLRDPTQALVKAIGAKYIAPLDPEVADGRRPISILVKNDFRGGSYQAHYWFAFYDPAARTKTQSVQLFAIFDGAKDQIRFGMGVGHYGRTYHENFIGALRAAPDAIAAVLDTLPDGLEVNLRFKDDSESRYQAAELATTLRSHNLDRLLRDDGKLRAIEIRRVAPLAMLVERRAALVDDIGAVLAALWPLFEAARTGVVFPGEALSLPAGDDNEIDEDDVPETLAELAADTSIPEEVLEEIEEALLARGQAVLVGPPGTSKTYVAEEFARYFVRQQPGRPKGEHKVIYMHASWAYEDFFEGIRPKVGGAGGLEFVEHRGAFLSWIEDTVKRGSTAARYLLVLDEINRCDTAAVLGELLQLMEVRGRPVQLRSGRAFSVPRRVYILGTMNSADRSIGRMDLALRRRFLFVDLLPDSDILQLWLDAVEGRNPAGLRAEALAECNAWLEKIHGIPREQQVGHALFMPVSGHEGGGQDGVLTGERLRRIVRYSVLPYVRELLAERGRDATTAMEQVQAFFAPFMAGDDASGA